MPTSYSKWGIGHDLHPDLWLLQSQTVLWSMALVYLVSGEEEWRNPKTLQPLPLHSSSLGQSNQPSGHPTDPADGAPHWRSPSGAAGRGGKWGVLDHRCRKPWPRRGWSRICEAACLYGSLFASDQHHTGWLVHRGGKRAAFFPWGETPGGPVWEWERACHPELLHFGNRTLKIQKSVCFFTWKFPMKFQAKCSAIQQFNQHTSWDFYSFRFSC